MCRNRPGRESVGVAPVLGMEEIDWDGLAAGGGQEKKALEMERKTRAATNPKKEEEGKEILIAKMSPLFWRNARKEWVSSLIGFHWLLVDGRDID